VGREAERPSRELDALQEPDVPSSSLPIASSNLESSYPITASKLFISCAGTKYESIYIYNMLGKLAYESRS
jgi:hypothetical protein